ncbi:MAG: RNB domain-containing ribonuclease, partial [bacterium]|nr:RNB domain-containing ribonuclease [Candidatus Colisoma equi]
MKNSSSDNGPLFPPPGKTPREDTAAVMKFYKLPKAFPPEVLREARQVSAPAIEQPFSNRLDLRKKFIFTCDPVTARDYDDALSLETDRKGNRILGVHIADVSHYVRPGTALDREAYRRSTSVYLCDRVVPMLPEELCNGVCSLVPNEDRLAFSVFMTFDRNGEMVKREFAKSIIRSKARFTYEQVMDLIRKKEEGKRKKCGGSASFPGKRETCAILAINELAQQLRGKRFAAGALDLEVPEAEVILDRNGEMTGIVTRPYDESHQMIEECMGAANEAVAKELWTRGIKILARLH